MASKAEASLSLSEKKNKAKLNNLCHEARIRWNLWSNRTKALVILITLWLVRQIATLEATLDPLVFSSKNGRTNQPRPRSSETSFAVVINTYKRPEMLRDAIQHYAQVCGRPNGVSQVFVVWAELEVEPPPPASFLDDNVPNAAGLRKQNNNNNLLEQQRSELTILRVPRDSLNSRFLPIDNLQSQAVFMVDDDVRVDCASLSLGFEAWRAHPLAMVGYYPRLAALSKHSQDDDKKTYVYQAWPIVWWRHSMNFVLTKASFFHAQYLSLYSDATRHPVEILEYVDKHMNCEDVAMALLVANATTNAGQASDSKDDLPMIYVEGSIMDKGLFNGISTSKGGVEHMDARSKCLDDLTQVYERHGWSRPLDRAFSLQESSWISHASNWRYRPSNPFEWGALENVFK